MARYIKAPGTDTVYRENSDGSRTPLTFAQWVAEGRPNPELDPSAALTGGERDIFTVITGMLKEYGLESLGGAVADYIRNGFSADTINVMIQDTEAYKKRFAANEVRRQKGLPVLSPAEYLSVESAYRQVMQAAGLPATFYDQSSDFEKWIGSDVAPAEVQRRAQAAQKLVESVDPAVRREFERFYTAGDIVAYALDPQRTTEILERQAQAARVGAAGSAQGVGVDRGLAERLVESGVDDAQARAGFGVVAQAARTGSALGALSGVEYGADDAINEVFFNDAESAEKRRSLASQERGRFGGSGGVTERSLGRSTAGRL